MDSTGDRRPDRSSVTDEKGNPFVSFSRLVDQQILSVLRTISDLPSSFSRSRPTFGDDSPSSAEQQKRWNPAVEEDERLERSFNGRSTPLRSGEPVEERCPFLTQREKKREEADSPARRLHDVLNSPSQHDLLGRIQDQRKDPLEEYAEADMVIESICNRLCQFYPCEEEQENEATRKGTALEMFLPGLGLVLPRSFSVKNREESLDSPLSLDNQDPFREHRARWTKAFEDLVRVSHGEPVSGSLQESSNNPSWKPSLAKCGLAVWKPQGMETIPVDDPEELATRQSENHSDEDATTELDLYDCFLGQQSPRPIPAIPTKTFANRNLSQTEPGKPSVISTLTTTQRRTLPDGSVYTQVVLKKRFSDGREESTETEHTTHGTARSDDVRKPMSQHPKDATSTSTPSLGHDGKLKQALGQKIEEKKESGWFWS
ncbi:MAG: hypothetical protein LQ343_001542 [Gyalolechia ehrenbergii]|nr:MAG: hypothetical protein LQ343_001542 [Gyalolechia ehrenbergii]